MTQKKTPRQQVAIDRTLRIRFAEKCLKERLIDSADNVKSAIEMLMKMYENGILDKIMPNVKLPKREARADDSRVQLNRKLKKDFSFRIWENTELIHDPRYGVRAIELLMQMYLDGKIEIKRED